MPSKKKAVPKGLEKAVKESVNMDESYYKHLKREKLSCLRQMVMFITGAKMKDLKGMKKDELIKEIMKRTQLHVIKRTKIGGNFWDSFKEGFELPFKAAAHILPFVV